MFADDTNLTAVGKTLGEAEERAGVDLRNVQKWLSLNKLSLNIAKTEYILIASRHKINTIDVQPTVKINSQPVKRVKFTKVLGVQIDEHLSCTNSPYLQTNFGTLNNHEASYTPVTYGVCFI